MKKTTLALTILMALGVTACQSGSNEQPGISQQENTQIVTLNSLSNYMSNAEEYLATATSAFNSSRNALTDAQNSSSEKTATADEIVAKNALLDAQKAISSIESTLTSATDLLKKNNSLEVQAKVARITAIRAEVTSLISQIEAHIASFPQAISDAKAKEAELNESARVATVKSTLESLLNTVKAQSTLVNEYLAKAQSATTSEEAIKLLSQAKTAQTEANNTLTKAQTLAKTETDTSLLAVKTEIETEATEASQAVQSIEKIATQLLAVELGISETEAETIVQGVSDVAAAKSSVATLLSTINTSASSTAKTAAIAATNAKAAAVEADKISTSLTEAKEALAKIQAAAAKANVAASINSSVASDAQAIQTSANEAAAKVAQMEQDLAATVTAKETRIARDKEATTNNAYNDSASIVQDYLDKTKREELLVQVNQKGTDVTSCTSSAKSPCSNKYAGAQKGDLLRQYTQTYSSYAVLREEYSEKVKPSNAYIALVNEDNLLKDKALVTNATYTGKASYSVGNNNNVVSYDFELNVQDNVVSGAAYNLNNKKVRTDFIVLENGAISVENGAVGFSGVANFEKLSKGKGTYQGVFSGANAEEVVGTFESSSADKDSSLQGAFAGKK